MTSRFMSLDEILGFMRCNSGYQRALIPFERFVGRSVRKPPRDETCACPVVLTKFWQITCSGAISPPSCRLELGFLRLSSMAYERGSVWLIVNSIGWRRQLSRPR
jgi:hypothetical protein